MPVGKPFSRQKDPRQAKMRPIKVASATSRQLESFVGHSADALAISDPQGRVLYAIGRI